MAYGIYSEDFLAICLHFVKGNISAPLSQLVETVELFQKENNNHYGTIDSDFRNILMYLCLEHHLIEELTSKTDYDHILDCVQVQEIVLPVLAKHYAYFNDSEAGWIPFEKGAVRLEAYDKIFQFFSSDLNKKPEEILTFLDRSSWSPSITVECLEKGNYKNTIWDSDTNWDDLLETICEETDES
jgi:hypothetical protein